jgi:hypothetical protein
MPLAQSGRITPIVGRKAALQRDHKCETVSQVGPVVLFVAAMYYRFARHDALRFYVFFGAAAIVACFYPFSLRQRLNPLPRSSGSLYLSVQLFRFDYGK